MSDVDVDVKNLFKKIGVDEPAYQELRRESRTGQARERWPLLNSLQAEEEAVPAKQAKRSAKKSELSRLFKSLEGGKAPPKEEAEPPPREAVAGPLRKLPDAGRPNPFNRLFEPQPPPKDFWQSMFDKLKKS